MEEVASDGNVDTSGSRSKGLEGLGSMNRSFHGCVQEAVWPRQSTERPSPAAPSAASALQCQPRS